MKEVTIVDYGMGNINSIKNMLRYLGYRGILTRKPNDIRKAEKIILPGVGHFKKAMENIKQLGLYDILHEAAMDRQIPILGICLGMQLLLSYSEEGNCDGLNLIKGSVKKFCLDTENFKIPHMGWDYIQTKNSSSILEGIQECPRYYFVHSYYAECVNPYDVLAETEYGIPFHSVIGHGNIFGTQFHPEKSHKYGMKIFQNFMENV